MTEGEQKNDVGWFQRKIREESMVLLPPEKFGWNWGTLDGCRTTCPMYSPKKICDG